MHEVTVRLLLSDRSPVLSVSGEPEALLGFGAGEILSGKVRLNALVHVDDQDLAEALFAPVTGELSGTVNLRMRNANGRIRCVSVSYQKVRTDADCVLELRMEEAAQLPRAPFESAASTYFAAIMDTTDDYIYFKNCNHVLIGASQSLLDLCSPTGEWSELIGKTDYDLFPEEFADHYYRLERRVFAGESVAREIHQGVGKGGKIGWIDNAKYPIHDGSGRIVGLYGIARDISELMRTKARLRDEQEHRRAVFDTVASPIFVKDSEHRIVAANQAFYDLFALGPEDVIGQTLTDKFSLELRDQICAADRRVLETGIPEREEQLPVLNGQQRTLIVKKTRLIDAAGERFVVCSMHDITSIRQAEAARRESEQRWQFAVEGAGDGLWDWSLLTNRVYYSKRWKAMLGFDEDEISDSLDEWSRRVHPDDLAQAMAAVAAHFTGRTENYVTEFRMKCKDGRWKWILDRGLVIERTADDKPLRAIGTHTDIDEHKLAMETLRRQNAVMSQFNTMAVGRELRMVQLKQEVNELCAHLGLPPRHHVVAQLSPPGDDD